MGTRICSSRRFVVPSAHVSDAEEATLARLLALRGWLSPVDPRACARPSVKAFAGWWHEAQDCVPLPESRVSKKSRRPRASLSADIGLSFGTRGAGKPGGRVQGHPAAPTKGKR